MNPLLLRPITDSILLSDTVEEECLAVEKLNHYFSSFLLFDPRDPLYQNPTQMSGGIALSTTHAADCLQDVLRTARFIKSAYEAITLLLKRSTEASVNILYAGCGPYATLILPLLHLFNPAAIRITLIDIHPTSVASVHKFISLMGLEAYFDAVTVENAITYTYPKSNLHLILCECMNQALLDEPQTAITANLLPQLQPYGYFIPQRIETHLTALSYSNCIQWPDFKSLQTNQVEKDIHLATLFQLGKNFQIPENYESPWIALPADGDATPDICIFTTITIFNSYTLNCSESYLTNPYCLASLPNFIRPSEIKLHYAVYPQPKWSFQIH